MFVSSEADPGNLPLDGDDLIRTKIESDVKTYKDFFFLLSE